MNSDVCCTCAKSPSAPQYDEKSGRPTQDDRRLECCGRIICTSCLARNPRFSSYCPFCQMTSGPSVLPQGLYDPPAYSTTDGAGEKKSLSEKSEEPPAYSIVNHVAHKEKDNSTDKSAEDVLHYVDPSRDSIQSLSLRYRVPESALRRKNGLYADHLLAARRTILIPGDLYKGGFSLSPQPIEGEEEEIRKSKIRRFMVTCKVSDYDVAVLYLEQSNEDLDMAVEAFLSDEKWEAEHPSGNTFKTRGKNSNSRSKFGVGTTTIGGFRQALSRHV